MGVARNSHMIVLLGRDLKVTRPSGGTVWAYEAMMLVVPRAQTVRELSCT